ncbi:hypothetical protein Lalb_Chr01g0017071 [Lupinus albus]|uniref:Uncharacterized protein n=1 Tax=Lupinus albus TaxID=3870 RepID=A0A6A4R433_LUPAL|nr:hypothetical protein Lalb_Chr01g0017071 [Lupinus albus]
MSSNRRGCKFKTTLNTLLQEQPNASLAQCSCNKGNNDMWDIESDLETRSKRNKEKEEIVLHLICWGTCWS